MAAEKMAELEAEGATVPRSFAGAGQLLTDGAIGEGTFATFSRDAGSGHVWFISPAELMFYCGSAECGRPMKFRTLTPQVFPHGDGPVLHLFAVQPDDSVVLKYQCRHCDSLKSLLVSFHPYNSDNWWITKAGEWPPRGEPLPASLLKFAGKAADMLASGYECELLGKGIGAYAYYRRFVEYRTNDLISNILKVAKQSNASESISTLNEALEATQYKRKLELARDGLPPALQLGGDNPLHTIFDLVSDKLHSASDSECLAAATQLRLLLGFLAFTVESVISDQEAIRVALNEAKNRGQRAAPLPKRDIPPDSNIPDIKDG